MRGGSPEAPGTVRRCRRSTSTNGSRRGTTPTSADMFEPAVVDPAVDFLADLAGDGAALELGIGTGRIALPLSRRGVRVHGIDLSPAMVAQLRAKPGADDIGVTIGDFATTRVDGHVPARLPRVQHDHEPDHAGRAGCVLPQRRRASRTRWVLRDRGRGSRAPAAPARRDRPGVHRDPDAGSASTSTTSPTQILFSHHYWVVDGKLEIFSAPYRYVWPSELDLMARLAGMTLRERWSDWNREPFTSDSTTHISVWEKAA